MKSRKEVKWKRERLEGKLPPLTSQSFLISGMFISTEMQEGSTSREQTG